MNRQLDWIRCRDFKRLGGAEELFAIQWLLRRGLLAAGGRVEMGTEWAYLRR